MGQKYKLKNKVKKGRDLCYRCACDPHCENDCNNCENCEFCNCPKCLQRFAVDG